MKNINNIKDKLTKFEAQTSVCFKNLLSNEMIIEHNINDIHYSASTIKVHIMLAVLNEIKLNKLKLKQIVDFPDNLIIDADSIYCEQSLKSDSIESLLHFMIITSDNVATNVLINLLGFEKINKYCNSIGLKNVSLSRYMNDIECQKRGIENYLTNADTLKMFELLYTKQILNSELCDYALKILSLQRLNNASLRYIWKDYICYHKTGGLEAYSLRNDCGIIIIKNVPYYFGFLVQHAKDKLTACKFIGEIFKDLVEFIESNN